MAQKTKFSAWTHTGLLQVVQYDDNSGEVGNSISGAFGTGWTWEIIPTTSFLLANPTCQIKIKHESGSQTAAFAFDDIQAINVDGIDLLTYCSDLSGALGVLSPFFCKSQGFMYAVATGPTNGMTGDVYEASPVTQVAIVDGTELYLMFGVTNGDSPVKIVLWDLSEVELYTGKSSLQIGAIEPNNLYLLKYNADGNVWQISLGSLNPS